MTRNNKGMIGWSIVAMVSTITTSIIFGNVLSVLLPVAVCMSTMTGREIWQYKTGQAKVFEWDDIARYTFVILVSCVITGFVLILIGVVE